MPSPLSSGSAKCGLIINGGENDAYKADTNFVDVVIQNSRLRLAINMKFADVIDPKGICKDITGVGKWGNGDVEVGLDSLDMLDDVMVVIEQAFRLQDVE